MTSQPYFPILRLLGGIILIVVLSLGALYWLMHPPMGDFSLMAQFLSITAIISAAVSYAAYRFGLLERTRSLNWALLGSYVLASLLTFLNVWATARLMFASEHDLMLATVLLIFASGIAMVLGYFLSTALTQRIKQLDETARQLEAGDLAARAPVRGNDEVAALAETFNRMAARLEQTDQKQRELDRLRRDLVAWTGHDLRTPLASIRAMVEALADDVVEDAETRQRYLNATRRDIQQLSALIDDFFQLAQLDSGGLAFKPESASLRDLISDTLESFSALALKQGITLEGAVAPEVDVLKMDVQAIGRVFNNLISNALRHTPAGGSVRVNVEPVNGKVFITISDNGEGISAEDLPHVFERFYRGEKSRNRKMGGAGLGLAIAQGIVAAHGGQIGVHSARGEGTKFFFTLPNIKS